MQTAKWGQVSWDHWAVSNGEGGVEVLEDRDKVERVWEECVRGFQSARGLIRGRGSGQ